MGLLETVLSVTVSIRNSSLLPIYALILSHLSMVGLFFYRSCLYSSIVVHSNHSSVVHLHNIFAIKTISRMLFQYEYTIPSVRVVKRPLICFKHVGVNARKEVSTLSPVSTLALALSLKHSIQLFTSQASSAGAKSNDYDIQSKVRSPLRHKTESEFSADSCRLFYFDSV